VISKLSFDSTRNSSTSRSCATSTAPTAGAIALSLVSQGMPVSGNGSDAWLHSGEGTA
jgi:hypothetical protein